MAITTLTPHSFTVPALGRAHGLVGLPVVIVAAAGLAVADLGLPTSAVAAPSVMALVGAVVVALAVVTVWAAAAGDSLSASLYAVGGGFFATYVSLSAADAQGWFGQRGPATDASSLWLGVWLVAVVALVPACRRQGLATAAMILLAGAALSLLLVADLADSNAFVRLAGVAIVGVMLTAVVRTVDLVRQHVGDARN